MSIVTIKLKSVTDNTYKIFIQKNCSDELIAFLKKTKLGGKYAIITDSKVKKLYGNTLLKFLKKNGLNSDIFSFSEGEKSKNLQTVENLANTMIEKKFDRKDAIIALGGGVVGDLAGFLASIYMRGIPYIQVPTTLMAMVDSSVGGKTGVDLKTGKNLIGTFTQPKAVFIDSKYLASLPIKQIRCGLAEVIKYGVIKDVGLFKFIEQHLDKILKLEEKTLNQIIKRSVEIKAEVVQKDEKESGYRMILNYGHTFGHALEKRSGYKLLHGYAISIGMVLANEMAVAKKLLPKTIAERIKKLFKRAGLPTSTMKKLTLKDLQSDKKRQGAYINLILPKKIGQVIIHKEKCL